MRIYGLLLLAGVLFFSCHPREKASFAIADLRKQLQPSLTRIVSAGYVGFGDDIRFIEKEATTNELRQMLRCEHPLLRAVACRILLKRPDVDHFELVMHHLDDTAVVFVDMGEWGLRYRMVSDDLVYNAKWRTDADKLKTADAIIVDHNYLEAAYSAVSWVEPKEKYYPSIKIMAARTRMQYDTYQLEEVWFALAQYQKKEDTRLILEGIQSHSGAISDETMGLIHDFPDTVYLDWLQEYSRKGLYRRTCRDAVWNPHISFFRTIAVYKNETSARILDSLLHRRPFWPCRIDTADLKDQLMTAIWDNPCKAYERLRTEIGSSMIEKQNREFQRERMAERSWKPDTSVYLPKDTSSEQVRWF